MKKYICALVSLIMLFSLSACAADVESGASTGSELTNPGEYLSSFCGNVKIDDTEFSLPCAFEDLSRDFELKEITAMAGHDKTEKDGFDLQTFNLFTKDDKYFGTASFAYYPDGSNRIWAIEKNYLSTWSTPLEEGDAHINDVTCMELRGLKTDASARSEVVEVLGGGFASDKGDDYFTVFYTYEDGAILVTYSKDEIAVDFTLLFK